MIYLPYKNSLVHKHKMNILIQFMNIMHTVSIPIAAFRRDIRLK